MPKEVTIRATRRHGYFLLAVALLVAFTLYLPGLAGPLLFDDRPALTSNILVQIDGASFDDWRTAAMSSDSGPFGRRVPMLTFGLNHALSGGFESVPLKLGNLFLHLCTGLLLFFWLLHLLRFMWRNQSDSESRSALVAALATTIWLLHPLHVSTVLYAVQRMAQFAAFFVTLGLFVYTFFRARWASRGGSVEEVLAALLWGLLITLFAIYSKENGAILPFLVLVCEITIFKGIWAGEQHKGLVAIAVSLLCIPVIVVTVFFLLDSDLASSLYAGRDYSLLERLLTQARILWTYVYWIVFPQLDLLGFQHDDVPVSTGLLAPLSTGVSVLSGLAVLVLAIFVRHKIPIVLFAILFYLVAHAIESSVWPLEMVYEHRNYIPSMSVCVLLAVTIDYIVRNYTKFRPIIAGAFVVLVLAIPLSVRVNTWSDALRLAYTNVTNHPESPRSSFFFAKELLDRYEAEVREAESKATVSSEDLIRARHHYELMHQQDPDNLAAISMLFFIDEYYLPELNEVVDWLDELDRAADVRVLQATDRIGLRFLLDCFESNACDRGHDQVLGTLLRLTERYPRSGLIYTLLYRMYYLRGHEADVLDAVVRRSQHVNPGDTTVYPWLITHFSREGDVAAVYCALGEWMKHDPGRRQLRYIKSLFDTDAD